MRWALRYQLLIPATLLLIWGVVSLGNRQASRQIEQLDEREDRKAWEVAQSLSADLPTALEQLPRLREENAGWDFAVFNGSELAFSTLKLGRREQQQIGMLPFDLEHDQRDCVVRVSGRWYWVSSFALDRWPPNYRFTAFYSGEHAETLDLQIKQRANLLTTAVGALILAGAWIISRRLSGRVIKIQQQVEKIARGDARHPLDERGSDEISQLARSVNELAGQLDAVKQQIQTAERSRVHSQIAGGVAHELRNGIHAARLSLEVFEENPNSIEMLHNAHAQLQSTEILVKRLLEASRHHKAEYRPVELQSLAQSVIEMVSPLCIHAEVDFESSVVLSSVRSVNDEAMRAALVNLCINGLEAAGRGGSLVLRIWEREQRYIRIEVEDSGPGPSPEIAATMFDPFITTKPEGVGLGLVLVRDAARQEGGAVFWRRENCRTIFALELPPLTPVAENELILVDSIVSR